MIQVPTYSQFRFFINKTFISDKVKETFKVAFDRLNNSRFNDIADYINFTAVKVVWPGITDDSTVKQYGVNRETKINRSRINKGGKAPDELIDKTLSITYSTKESYLNWLIFYVNFLEHFKYRDSEKKVHLPDCGIHIMDDNGSLLMSVVFTGVTFSDLEKMEFNSRDSKFVNKDFVLTLNFVDFNMRFYVDNDLTEKAIIV